METNGIEGIRSAGKRRLALRLSGLFVAGLLVACVQQDQDDTSGNEVEMSQAAATVVGTPRLAVAAGANKRYFVNAATGSPVYMVGSHTWNNLKDRSDHANLDYTAYLASMSNNWNSSLGGLAKHRLMRMWNAEGSTNVSLVFTPNQFVPTKDATCSGAGTAKYDFGTNPDAPNFNQAYFDRLAQRISQAKASNIYVSLILFEAWSMYDNGYGSSWPTHWFNPNMNCNSINGNANSTYSGQYRDGMAVNTRAPMKGGPASPGRTISDQNTIWRIQVAYMKKVVDTIHSAAAGGGDNVLYEIMNEGGWFTTDWQDDMINEIKTYENSSPRVHHPVGKTTVYCGAMGPGTWPANASCTSNWLTTENAMLTNSPADWISLWQSAYYGGTPTDPDLAPATKVDMSDSDHGYLFAFHNYYQWKHFMRGHNLWYMEDMDLLTDTTRMSQRQSLGHILAYADKVNLINMVPQDKGTTTPCSTGYSLNNATDGEYMALQPGTGAFTYSVPAGTYTCEWFQLDAGTIVTGSGCGTGTVINPSSSWTPPVAKAVLFLKSTGGGTAPGTPAAPTFGAVTSSSIVVNWTAPSGSPTSYTVKRSTTSGGAPTGTTVYTGSALTYTNTSLAAATTYYYVVSATNAYGTSAYSSQGTQATSAAGTAPSTPAAPTFGAVTSSSIVVNWTAPSGSPTSYTVKRSTTSGGAPTGTTVYTGSALTYTNTSLAAATTYYYVVSATNAYGTSAYSSQGTQATSAAGTAPSMPAAPTFGAVTSSSIVVNWTAPSGSPTSYTVKRSTTSGGAPTGTTVYTGSALTYTNTSLAAATTYYYVVSATNAYGTSAYSSQASTTTSASGSTAFVTSFTPGASRNDYTRVGMKITVGSSNIVVTAVGRIFKSGNTGTHTVHIETLSGADVMAGVAINVSSGTAGQITYVNLGTPVTLLANTSYYIGSDETVGGDSWYDSTTSIAHTSVVSATVPFYRDAGGVYQVLAGPDKSFGPVSFKHQ